MPLADSPEVMPISFISVPKLVTPNLSCIPFITYMCSPAAMPSTRPAIAVRLEAMIMLQ